MNERKADIKAIKERHEKKWGSSACEDPLSCDCKDIPALIADLEAAEALAQRFEDALGEAQRECLESDAELEKLEAEVERIRETIAAI